MSGLSEKQYDRNKRARDSLEKKLIDSGVSKDKASKIATETANTTDNRQKEK